MKVTGYKLREGLRAWQLRRETAAVQFPDTLKVFPGEDKPTPESIVAQVEKAERAIAIIQSEQTTYNTNVVITVDGERMSLLHAIKLVGGLGRVEKLWRVAATGKRDKYAHYRSDDPGRIKADEILAKRAISPEDAAKRVGALATEIGRLREAIAVGNATVIEIENLDAALFE